MRRNCQKGIWPVVVFIAFVSLALGAAAEEKAEADRDVRRLSEYVLKTVPDLPGNL